MRLIHLLLFYIIVANVLAITAIQSFDDFVRFYGKHYKDDEYANRRDNFVKNTNRLLNAKKLSGIPLHYSFYSDFSEARFIKSLMTNNVYPAPDLSEMEYLKNESIVYKDVADWMSYTPVVTTVHSSIKCASNWAVAVTSIMYMQYKRMDPLWNEMFSIQQLLDCVNDRKAATPDSCDGASLESALRYVYEKGICLERDYNRFTGSREKCHRVTCNRYFIKSFKRVYPEMPSFLEALSRGPLLTTVGVNPNLLQFYISNPDNQRAYMTGQYHRYYVSGIVNQFSLEEGFVSLHLPTFHYFSNTIYYRLSSSCLREKELLWNCPHDADVLTQYAYSVEVEPLPPFTRTFEYSIVNGNSLYVYTLERNWILPWSLALYDKVDFHGFHSEVLMRLITSTTETFQEIQDETCVIRSFSLRGLHASMCEVFSESAEPLHDCQLNHTHIADVLALLQHCHGLESLSLIDHLFDGKGVSTLLQSIIDRKSAWTKLNRLQIAAVLYQDPYSQQVRDQMQTLQAMHVKIDGILLLDFANPYPETVSLYPAMKAATQTSLVYSGPIHVDVYEQFIIASPMMYATKVVLQNTCTEDPITCAYVPQLLSSLWLDQPHYNLRYLDLTNNQISNKEMLRLFIALKHYPRLTTFILDGNNADDAFYDSFRVFIQDNSLLPALRRVSFLNNHFSKEGCLRMKQIFLTQYSRSTTIYC